MVLWLVHKLWQIKQQPKDKTSIMSSKNVMLFNMGGSASETQTFWEWNCIITNC
jgi:hypothetical protein